MNTKEIFNKKATFDYEILERIEAGIVLKGSEVKSIREGKCNLKNSFCKFFKNELFVLEMHISQYKHDNLWEKTPETRERKLLLHKKELEKLEKKSSVEGITVIPLKLYFNERNKCKVLIGLCKGKKNYDKKESLKEKDILMDMKKQLKNY